MARDDAKAVWDALVAAGTKFDLADGLLALDVARIEAGLCSSTWTSSARAKRWPPRSSTVRSRWGWAGSLTSRERFIGRLALEAEQKRGPRRQVVGLTLEWPDIEALRRCRLPPLAEATASRLAVPVFQGRRRVGRMTSSTWSRPEENDWACDGRRGRFTTWHTTRSGAHRRRRSPSGGSRGDAHAVLQSCAEDTDAARVRRLPPVNTLPPSPSL